MKWQKNNRSDNLKRSGNILVFEVELNKLPAVKVLSLRGMIPKYNQEGILWEKLGKYIGEHKVVCHSDGEFIYKEYTEIPLATTLRFTGPFDGPRYEKLEYKKAFISPPPAGK